MRLTMFLLFHYKILPHLNSSSYINAAGIGNFTRILHRDHLTVFSRRIKRIKKIYYSGRYEHYSNIFNWFPCGTTETMKIIYRCFSVFIYSIHTFVFYIWTLKRIAFPCIFTFSSSIFSCFFFFPYLSRQKMPLFIQPEEEMILLYCHKIKVNPSFFHFDLLSEFSYAFVFSFFFRSDTRGIFPTSVHSIHCVFKV